MVSITFNLKEGSEDRIIDAIKGLYPIPQTKPDLESEPVDDFTPAQWAKEYLRRYIKEVVNRYESKVAKDAVTVTVDDDIVTTVQEVDL